MDEIMVLLGYANDEQVRIDECDSGAIEHYWWIGNHYSVAAELGQSVLLDGKTVKVKSGASFARAAGIPQSSVSRGFTIHKAFPNSVAARKAYMAQDKGFAEWVSSLVERPSNRQGTGKGGKGKGKGKGRPSVQDVAELAAKLTPKQRAELLIVLKNMK